MSDGSHFDPIPGDAPAQTAEQAKLESETLAAVAEEMGKAPKNQADRDREVLAAALSRLARLHGQSFGEHVADLDTAGLSAEFVDLVSWAKAARMP